MIRLVERSTTSSRFLPALAEIGEPTCMRRNVAATLRQRRLSDPRLQAAGIAGSLAQSVGIAMPASRRAFPIAFINRALISSLPASGILSRQRRGRSGEARQSRHHSSGFTATNRLVTESARRIVVMLGGGQRLPACIAGPMVDGCIRDGWSSVSGGAGPEGAPG